VPASRPGSSQDAPQRELGLPGGLGRDELLQAVIDGASVGMGLERILAGTPGAPSLEQIKRDGDQELVTVYLDAKARYARRPIMPLSTT